MIDSISLGILERLVDPQVIQTQLTKEQALAAMQQNVFAGQAYVFRYGQTVWYMVYRSRFVGDLHVFSEEKSANIIKSARAMFDDARQRGLHRVEARTHNKGFLPLAKRCGMTLEGIRYQSYFTGSRFIDEYELGLIL